MPGRTYKESGVDIDSCDAWLASLKKRLPGIGGFSGVFPLAPHIAGMTRPCLVSGTDGVGTKVLVARAAGDLSTIGIDCVAMVVNDLVCCGARPVIFLDYLAVGRFDAAQADAILEGLRAGCEHAGCELVGGETAELPGLFTPGDFDVAGFGVGVVDESRVIDGSTIRTGDVVIGLPSSGLHSNGFSLARSVLPKYQTDPELARVLLVPTVIYVRPVLELLDRIRVKGIAHITGGGLPGNLCRVLPPTVDARLNPNSWERPDIFNTIARRGSISDPELYKTFNMGIGLCLVIDRSEVDSALSLLALSSARQIGEIVEGTGKVQIQGVTP